MKYSISIAPELREAAPDYKLVLIEADVTNGPTPEALTKAITEFGEGLREVMEIPDIATRPGIAATRKVYKALGKEPNRYRPSHEQMMRRILQGKGLYEVSALVDAGNLLSLMSGYSVGVFDADKVQGFELCVGVGREGEPYTGIGRGQINIGNLPAVRDAAGAIGTPTSDNERTMTGPDTKHVVITVHAFGPDMPVDETIGLARKLLEMYCGATMFDAIVI